VQSRAQWQVERCPRWCAGGHRDDDHPDDRVHRSASLSVPVVARRTWFEGAGIRRMAESCELEVALSRVDGDSQTWLYVGGGPGAAIEVTAESGHRLVQAMVEALDRPRSR